jgi:hypothetical protein
MSSKANFRQEDNDTGEDNDQTAIFTERTSRENLKSFWPNDTQVG